MKLSIRNIRAILVAGAISLALPALVAPAAGAMDDTQRKEVEAVVRDYLLAHPEILIEMRDALESKKRAEQEEKQKLTLAAEKDAIYASNSQIEIGDKSAPVTIVEFFDYNCGFCQRAMDDMNRLVESKKVRFILKEFPVLGEESVEAARVSLAFNRLMPEKAAEFHRALLGASGRKDGQMALELAVTLGANASAMKAEAEKSEVLEAIKESYRLGDGLGITGTPSYVIGEEVVFGAVGFETLGKKVANLGACGKTLC